MREVAHGEKDLRPRIKFVAGVGIDNFYNFYQFL